MKVMIDIPEETYNKMRRGEKLYPADANVAIFAIETGTPLGEREDAISRQAVIDMTGLSEWFDSSDNYNKFVFALSELPPVIPQYTEAEIQRMQDLEFAEIQKAYEIGKEEGSSEKPNKWIPVSEGEYPEAYTEVLVYDNSDYFIAWWTGIRGRWDSYNSQFDINTPIVAWMPIEPYKASQTGKEDD